MPIAKLSNCWRCNLNSPKRVVVSICLVVFIVMCGTNYFDYNANPLELFNFEYVIKGDSCSKEVFLLVLVHSAADHFKHRDAIRETWGYPGAELPAIRVVFLLAIAEEHQQEIERENAMHKDIVQGNFIDSYRNLTYKHAMGLSWAARHCNETKYLLKMDDDIFMDIYQFMEYIRLKIKHRVLEKNIACYLQKGMPVVRDPVSKWYVSKREYPSETFVNYCSGWAYLTTPRVAAILYETVKQVPFFWVDDVHITGTAAKKANVGLIRMNNLFARETDGLLEWSKSSEDLLWNKVFAPTWGDLKLSRTAHRRALVCYVKKCKCCYERKTVSSLPTTTTTVRGIAKLVQHQFHRSYRNKFKKIKDTNSLFQ